MHLAPKKPGLEQIKYSFPPEILEESNFSGEVVGTEGEEKPAKDSSEKLYFIIQEPRMEDILASLSAAQSYGMKPNLAAGGQGIFNSSCIECSEEIKKSTAYQLSIFFFLADTYLLPASVDIKKN